MNKLAVCLMLMGLLATGAAVWYRLPTDDPYSGILVVLSEDGQGSCVIVSKCDTFWHAVTAKHVIEPIGPLMVDGYTAEVAQIHATIDLALVRFQSPEDYRIYEFAEARQGEPCVLVGWFGEVQLIYHGYVVNTDWDERVAVNTGVFPGCSGGAVFNESKKIIGVTTSMAMMAGYVLDSTAFCIPEQHGTAMISLGD